MRFACTRVIYERHSNRNNQLGLVSNEIAWNNCCSLSNIFHGYDFSIQFLFHEYVWQNLIFDSVSIQLGPESKVRSVEGKETGENRDEGGT